MDDECQYINFSIALNILMMHWDVKLFEFTKVFISSNISFEISIEPIIDCFSILLGNSSILFLTKSS